MYKNAHLQNITLGPKQGMEEREELISQSWSWPGRRKEIAYLWFFKRDGFNYVGLKQTFPQIKVFPSGVITADPHTKLAVSTKESNPEIQNILLKDSSTYNKTTSNFKTRILIFFKALMWPTLSFNKRLWITFYYWPGLVERHLLGTVCLCPTTVYSYRYMPEL